MVSVSDHRLFANDFVQVEKYERRRAHIGDDFGRALIEDGPEIVADLHLGVAADTGGRSHQVADSEAPEHERSGRAVACREVGNHTVNAENICDDVPDREKTEGQILHVLKKQRDGIGHVGSLNHGVVLSW